jgi:hypothetical protein
MQITSELKTIIQNYPELDIAAVKRQLDPEKKNYKKVFYWKDIPKIKAEEVRDDVNYILRSSEKYADIDLDFLNFNSFEKKWHAKAQRRSRLIRL